MDSPSLVSLPAEIILLIAEHLIKCRDVLSSMRIYLASRGRDEDTTRWFQEILFRNDARRFQTPISFEYGNSPTTIQPLSIPHPFMRS
jgi:hypothetical protein